MLLFSVKGWFPGGTLGGPRIQLYPWTYGAPISRVKSPQLSIFKAIYKGYYSIYSIL